MTTQIRHRGTQSDGNAFSEKQKNAVWEKAQRAMESHPFLTAACQFFSKEFKKGTYVLDDYGHVICREEYGKKTKHGWEIDHICAVENKETYQAGSESVDEIDNLRVLHWKSNERKGQNDSRIYELEYEHMILNKSA